MSTESKFNYKYADYDGDSIEVHRFDSYRGRVASLSVNEDRTVWVSTAEAPKLAQAILDAADARPCTDPEPKPEKYTVTKGPDGCYYVNGEHYSCGDNEATEDLEKEIAVLRFQLAERKQTNDDKKTHRDRVTHELWGGKYDALHTYARKAVDRIVELEDAK